MLRDDLRSVPLVRDRASPSTACASDWLQVLGEGTQDRGCLEVSVLSYCSSWTLMLCPASLLLPVAVD